MHSGVIRSCIKAAADSVDLSVDSNDPQVIPGTRQRRQLTPPSGSGVVHFICSDRYGIDSASADSVKLSIESGEAHGPSRTLHGREGLPCVGCRVVLKGDVLRVHVNVPGEATCNVNFSVHAHGANMTETARHRRSHAPTI